MLSEALKISIWEFIPSNLSIGSASSRAFSRKNIITNLVLTENYDWGVLTYKLQGIIFFPTGLSYYKLQGIIGSASSNLIIGLAYSFCISKCYLKHWKYQFGNLFHPIWTLARHPYGRFRRKTSSNICFRKARIG